MTENNPYINQQEWGRHLLSRLNNIVDKTGKINTWSELPLTGKGDQPLGEEDDGLTGILQSNESEIVSWDGEKWNTLLKIPISFEGKPVETQLVEAESLYINLLDPGISSLFAYIIQSAGVTNSFTVTKYSKVTGQIEWTTSAQTRVGYNYFASVSDGTPVSYDFDNSNLYISGIEYTSFEDVSSPGYVSLFCFRLIDGAFLWRTELATSTNASFGPMGLVSNGASVFLSQRFTASIFKVNTSNGIIEATHTLSLPVLNLVGRSWWDSVNGRFVYWSRNSNAGGGKPVIYLVDGSGNSIHQIFDFNTDPTVGTVSSNPLVQDPVYSNLFYFFDTPADTTKQRLFTYNSSTNTISLFCPEFSQVLFGSIFMMFKTSPDFLTFLSPSGGILQGFSITPSGVQMDVDSIALPGKGQIASIRRLSVSGSLEINSPAYLTRFEVITKGVGPTRITQLAIVFSQGGQRLVYFKNSFLSDTEEKLFLKAAANFRDLYSPQILSELIESKTILLSSSSPATSDAPAIVPDVGFDVGLNMSGFAINGTSTSAFSAASKGYTGGGQNIAGIGFGTQPINGQMVHTRSSALFSALSLFDLGIGKFFFKISLPQTVNTVIPNFPDASGLTVTSSNFLGIKTETPAYPLDVVGTARATTLMNSGGAVTSDERIKVGILPLDGLSLWEICEELVAISFLYQPDVSFEVEETTTDEDGNQVSLKTTQKWPLPQGIQYGWSAQKIQKQFPELVSEDPQSGILYLNREALFPIFQSAATAKIKQLEELIAQKDTLLTQLQSALESLTARVEALENAAA